MGFEANIVRESDARGIPTPPPPAAPAAVVRRPKLVNAFQSAPVPQSAMPEIKDIADKPFPPDMRHKYSTIMGVLVGMIAVLMAAIIGVLKSRDIQ